MRVLSFDNPRRASEEHSAAVSCCTSADHLSVSEAMALKYDVLRSEEPPLGGSAASGPEARRPLHAEFVQPAPEAGGKLAVTLQSLPPDVLREVLRRCAGPELAALSIAASDLRQVSAGASPAVVSAHPGHEAGTAWLSMAVMHFAVCLSPT